MRKCPVLVQPPSRKPKSLEPSRARCAIGTSFQNVRWPAQRAAAWRMAQDIMGSTAAVAAPKPELPAPRARRVSGYTRARGDRVRTSARPDVHRCARASAAATRVTRHGTAPAWTQPGAHRDRHRLPYGRNLPARSQGTAATVRRRVAMSSENTRPRFVPRPARRHTTRRHTGSARPAPISQYCELLLNTDYRRTPDGHVLRDGRLLPQ